MTGASNPVLLRRELEATLRRMMENQEYASFDEFVNDNLAACVACRTRKDSTPAGQTYETEMLRMRIMELEGIIRKKDEQISVLLELWEHCKVQGEPAPGLEISPELEDRIGTIIRDWYYSVERKDHSGADGKT